MLWTLRTSTCVIASVLLIFSLSSGTAEASAKDPWLVTHLNEYTGDEALHRVMASGHDKAWAIVYDGGISSWSMKRRQGSGWKPAGKLTPKGLQRTESSTVLKTAASDGDSWLFGYAWDSPVMHAWHFTDGLWKDTPRRVSAGIGGYDLAEAWRRWTPEHLAVPWGRCGGTPRTHRARRQAGRPLPPRGAPAHPRRLRVSSAPVSASPPRFPNRPIACFVCTKYQVRVG